MRANRRREKFLASLRGAGPVAGDRFDSVRALWSAAVPLVKKNRKWMMGSILIIKASGELTPEGKFLETQGWTRPREPRRWATGTLKEGNGS